MGLLSHITTPLGHEIAFWNMRLDLDALSDLTPLTAEDKVEAAGLHHDKRKREWIASRAALRIGLQEQGAVLYHPTGKPYLEGSELSLSHCLPLAGALKHPSMAGIDIQIADEKIAVIRSKFAHPDELAAADNCRNSLDYLTILWSAKEALFKVYGQGLAFAEQLRIDPFEFPNSLITAQVMKDHTTITHELRVLCMLDHWVVYVYR